MALTHEIVAFGGWENNLAISNPTCELLVTLDVGPRILSFALAGGVNVFKVFDAQLGESAEETWQSRGGHRLWLAPESFPFSYYPDNEAVEHTIHPNGAITLVAPDEMPQGFSKQLDITLDETKPRVRIVHRLINVVDEEQEVAAWALSVMDAGGIEIIPQPPTKPHPGLGPGDFTPNRSLVLWPFTDLSDARYFIGERFITLSQSALGGATKLGLNHEVGWVGYWNEGTLFVKRFSHDPKATYPDRNCNFETFTNEEILEVETLSPLQTLKPGGTLEWVEEWELYADVPAFEPTDEDAIAAALKIAGVI